MAFFFFFFLNLGKPTARAGHTTEHRKELLEENLADSISDLELRAWVSAGAEAASVSCLLRGRLPPSLPNRTWAFKGRELTCAHATGNRAGGPLAPQRVEVPA